jgi:hypothetical protein
VVQFFKGIIVKRLELALKGNILHVLDKLEPYRDHNELLYNAFFKMNELIDSGENISEKDLQDMNESAKEQIQSINELEKEKQEEQNRNRGFRR